MGPITFVIYRPVERGDDPVMHPKRLIWFCSTEHLAEHPEWLPKLRDEIGLTTIMPESHVCHTSGFRASDDIAARGPFEDWRDRPDLWPRGLEGTYPPVAGTVGGFDDAPLLKVIEVARAAGIEVWGHLGLYSYGGDAYPEYAMQDIEGRPLDVRYKRWGIGLCPSRSEINDWTRDCLVDVASRYDVDGFCVDHARFPAPASPSALLACGCERCQDEAGRLGYDFVGMRSDVVSFLERLRQLTAADIRSLSTVDGSILSGLDAGPGVVDWFRFRTDLLACRMAEFRTAIGNAASRNLVFGSDVFAPSIAYLGGQNYASWEQATDYLTGGSSHGGVVGWATGATNLAAEWTTAICGGQNGPGEGETLGLIYALFGVSGLGLPDSVSGLNNGELPIGRLYDREVAKLRATTSGRVPLYPPIAGGSNPELLRELCSTVVKRGCDGAMITVDPSQDENLAVIREVLGEVVR